MAVRVNGARLRHRYRARLERERRAVLQSSGEDECPVGWRDGFCAGLEFAQAVIGNR